MEGGWGGCHTWGAKHTQGGLGLHHSRDRRQFSIPTGEASATQLASSHHSSLPPRAQTVTCTHLSPPLLPQLLSCTPTHPLTRVFHSQISPSFFSRVARTHSALRQGGALAQTCAIAKWARPPSLPQPGSLVYPDSLCSTRTVMTVCFKGVVRSQPRGG